MNIFELHNIKQVYGTNEIISDLSVNIEDIPGQGQITVILGESGCGKSTILRYIAGLQKPTQGKIYYMGQEKPDNMSFPMVFQQYSSMPWLTVKENIQLGMKLHNVDKKIMEDKANQLIQLVGLSGHEHKFAKHPLLSGGQMQRVAIARSLAVDSSVLLLDEPFGALDIKTRLEMQDLLINVWKTINNCTVLMVTHDIPEAVYLADNIIIMKAKPGRISEVIKNPYNQKTSSIKTNPGFKNFVEMLEHKLMN